MALIKKTFNFADNIEILEKNISSIENYRDTIVNSWISHAEVTKVLNRLNIGINSFKKDYAYQILDNHISIFKKEKELGSPITVTRFLSFYNDRQIESVDLYVIFIHLRETIVNHFFNLNIMNAEIYNALTYVFDKNFEDILKSYGNTVFQIEQEIQEYKQIFSQYNVALDQSALVSKTDAHGIITYVNQNFVKISGYSEEELLGYSHNIIRHPDTTTDFFKNLWTTIKKGDTFRANIKNRKKDGSEYYVDTTILPLYDNNHKIKEYLSVRYEVTELVKARDIAIEAEKLKDIFLANMSHEIRTPLNAMMGFIGILKEEEKDTQKLQYLKTIDATSQSLTNIINDILDFSKIESGKLDIEYRDFDTHFELQSTKDLFTAKCSEKNINLVVQDEGCPNYLNGDVLRIKQVVSNLLSNAIKFTSENKYISLTVSYKNEMLHVRVKDEGIGISEEYQKTIFDSFSQADSSTTRKYGGTGLGLSISYNLVSLMGGELKVTSTLGHGSEFYFSLPLKIGKEIKTIPLEALKQDLSHLKLLLVEDNKPNQLFMKVMFKKMGLEFDIANDGIEAIECFKNNKYDVILMDENMPNMNGIEATKHIRKIEKEQNLKHTPIVALTANALKGDREKFLEAGMDDYLTKPVNKGMITKVLNAV